MIDHIYIDFWPWHILLRNSYLTQEFRWLPGRLHLKTSRLNLYLPRLTWVVTHCNLCSSTFRCARWIRQHISINDTCLVYVRESMGILNIWSLIFQETTVCISLLTYGICTYVLYTVIQYTCIQHTYIICAHTVVSLFFQWWIVWIQETQHPESSSNIQITKNTICWFQDIPRAQH